LSSTIGAAVPAHPKARIPAAVAASAAARPGIALAAVGLAIAVSTAVPELLLVAHLSRGGGMDPFVVTCVNRLLTVVTVVGAAVCGGGVVLEVARRLPRADPPSR
jgi:hypothetical protein